jgi:hypothetical protein
MEERTILATSTRLPLVVAEARSTQALAQLWKEDIAARILWSLAKIVTANALYIFTFLYLVEGVREVVLEKGQARSSKPRQWQGKL